MSTMTRVYRSLIPSTPAELFEWHARPATFSRLAPPWMRVEVVDQRGTIRTGDWKLLRIPVAGDAGFSWKLVHNSTVHGMSFVDVQERGPFVSWRHEHRFGQARNGMAMLDDIVSYALPGGMLGGAIGGRAVGTRLDRLFRFRHHRTQHDIDRIARDTSRQKLRVAVTGASGLVGRRLTSLLEMHGHEVIRMVRRRPDADHEVYWNPDDGTVDAAALEDVDAVVHLAGVSIAGGRWTRKRKALIECSRVEGTSLLARTLANLQRPPSVFVSTSAIGYYGDGGQNVLTEDAPVGEGFLADVCRAWESAAEPARDAGIRVVNPRFGLVLAGDGGMLPLIAKVYRAGIGGPLGPGTQFMSWIAIDDLVDALYESIVNPALEGPVNAVSPAPVTGADFASILGSVLRRPSVFKVPSPALKVAGGQLADELLLVSQRVAPAKLEDIRFPFRFASLEDALRFELGRDTSSGAIGETEDSDPGRLAA